MALTPTAPIDVLDIQNEYSVSSLVGAINAESTLSTPASALDFLGKSSVTDQVIYDSSGWDAGVTHNFLKSDATYSVAEVRFGDIELGAEGNRTPLPEWGKCAIDLSGFTLSNYSTLEIVARITYNTTSEDTYLFGKWSNTQHDVASSIFDTNYDFREFESVGGGNLTTSFQTFSYSVGSTTYLNLCGFADTGGTTVLRIVVDIDSIYLRV